jgi:hypothetical protein
MLWVLNVGAPYRFRDERIVVDELLVSGPCAAGNVLDEREFVR